MHTYKTMVYYLPFLCKTNNILLIIKSLDSSRSRGHDNILIKMIKICPEFITILLKTIFEESLKNIYISTNMEKLM